MSREAMRIAIERARSHFDRGADILYLTVDDDGTVEISTQPPNRTVFVAARSVDQVERFVAELHRRSA